MKIKKVSFFFAILCGLYSYTYGQSISGEVIRTTSTDNSYQEVVSSEADKAKGKGIRCEKAEDGEVTEFIQQYRTRYGK